MLIRSRVDHFPRYWKAFCIFYELYIHTPCPIFIGLLIFFFMICKGISYVMKLASIIYVQNFGLSLSSIFIFYGHIHIDCWGNWVSHHKLVNGSWAVLRSQHPWSTTYKVSAKWIYVWWVRMGSFPLVISLCKGLGKTSC